jgi:hypothetical protein
MEVRILIWDIPTKMRKIPSQWRVPSTKIRKRINKLRYGWKKT